MSAALFGLVVAVVTACAYVLLTEHMDYASVPRRQLDAWAAMAAMTCLVGILFGGVEARTEAMLRAEQARQGLPVGGTAPMAPIPRLVEPPLGGAQAVPAAAEAPDVRVELLPDPAVPAVADPVADVFDADDDAVSSDRSPDPAPIVPSLLDEVLPVAPVPEAERWAVPTPIVRRTGPSGIFAPATATPAVAERPGKAVVITAVPPLPTPVPPTATLAPTLAPTAPPAPTAFCGDPNDIRVVLDIGDADADRRSDPQGIRYRSTVRNDTAFPLNLTSIVITAQDSRSGADQFGSDRRIDVQIGPGGTAEINGIVKLDKYPSPFGRSELCVAFVAETCGRRSDQRPVTRRCTSISGF